MLFDTAVSRGDQSQVRQPPGPVRRLSSPGSRGLGGRLPGAVHGPVAAIYKEAAQDRLVAGSPCAETRLPKAAPHLVEPLSTERVQALAASVPDRYRAAVLLAAGTGIRRAWRSA